jgi:hypothetical protein
MATKARPTSVELAQMVERNVFNPIMKTKPGDKLINSLVSIKDKYNANGEFDKSKARLVALGNPVDRTMYAPDELTLIASGYTAHPAEPCILTKVFDTGRVTIALFVDDLLIAAQSEEALEECITEIKKDYKDLKVDIGTHLSFLGLDIKQDLSTGSIEGSQPAYIAKILMDHQGSATTPATLSSLKQGSKSMKLSDTE